MKCCTFIFFLFLKSCLLAKILNNDNDGDSSESYSSSTIMLSKLLREFYCGKSSVTDIIFDGDNELAFDVLENLVFSFGSCTTIQINMFDRPRILEKRKRVLNVIMIKNFENFILLIENISKFNFDFQGYFSVIFVEKISSTQISKVFEKSWKLYIHNFNLITISERKTFSLFTYEPFQTNKCGDTNPEIKIPNAQNHFKQSVELFPNKLKNFHNCPIRIPRVNYFPAIQFSENSANSTLTGIEGELLMAIKTALNFEIEVVVLENEEEKWGLKLQFIASTSE